MTATRAREANGAPARANLPDRTWGAVLTVLGLAVLVVASLIIAELARIGGPALAQTGVWAFVKNSAWDVTRDVYGALPFIYGTLVTSGVALVLALPVSVGLALFLTEMSPPRMRSIVSFPISLLAGIPSVVYGLWGLFVIVPRTRFSYLSAGIVLAIMILPTITSMAIE